MPIDFTEFEKLEQQFQSLNEDNYSLAFTLWKKSATLQDYYGARKAEQDKLLAKNLLIAKGKEAEIKREYIEKSNVSRGREEYLSDPRVLEANTAHLDSIEVVGKLESLCKYLGNIYYVSKSIYERGNSKYNQN